MSSRGAARRRISWELVEDTDESDRCLPKLEESYIDDFFLIAEINNALMEFQWNAVVDSCDKALAERPRWSEVRAARDRAASYLEAGGQPPPAPVFYVVVRGAFVKYNMNWGPRAAHPETKMFDYVRLRGGGGAPGDLLVRTCARASTGQGQGQDVARAVCFDSLAQAVLADCLIA